MGLLRAALDSFGGVLSDQWREYFYCDSLDEEVLVAKGQKRIGGRSSNKKGDDNIISNGSIIAVNDGQCMIIVEQGLVVDLCAEPGEYVYDFSSEPSVFYGGLDAGIKKSFAVMGKRFGFGGDTGKDQRVYFFNTKELVGNKYGTPNPVPFRVVDKNIGLDVDISIRCHGEYSYKIVDPLLFYTNVCGNVDYEFRRDEIESQLKSELMTALQPAFAKISEMGIRYSALPGHTYEIAEALNQVLSKKWKELRGIEIVSFGVSSVNASQEDEQMIKDLQKSGALRSASMAAATIAGAQADAMRMAAQNEGGMGALGGFMGMNMAQNAGGVNAGDLFAMGQKESQQGGAQGWTCQCGTSGNMGNFCQNCGRPRPSANQGWTCQCGASGNTGNFCQNCGKPKPAGF